MTAKVQIDTKDDIRRKQCSRCDRMNIYPLTMKDSRVYLSSILWQEYQGKFVCPKCFSRQQGCLRTEMYNIMTNSTSNIVTQKKCDLCGSNKTDIINKEGTLVFRWLRNPYRKGTWMCGKCCRRRYLKVCLRGLIRVRVLDAKERE